MAEQDPFKAGLQGPPAVSAPPLSPTISDPFKSGLSSSAPKSAPTDSDPFKSGVSSPSTEDNQSMLGKAWDWANTPLINFNKSNEGGFTGGAEDVASGLTSPLSIGLTVGTLGGGALLRGLGIAAEETPLVLRGIQSAIDAGLTAQGAVQVAKESPRVLDAWKEGNYDLANRLLTHVVAGGAMTALGGSKVLSDAGPLADEVSANLGFKVKPSETNRVLSYFAGKRRVDREKFQDEAKKLGNELNETFKDLSPEERAGVMHLVQAEGNQRTLIDRFNTLMDSAGTPEKKLPGGTPKYSLGAATKADPANFPFDEKDGIDRFTYPIKKDDQLLGSLDIHKRGDVATIDWIGDTRNRSVIQGAGPLTGEIGPKGLGDILRQFAKENPDVKTIQGIRIGGAKSAELRPPTEIPVEKLIDTAANRRDEIVSRQHIKDNYTPEEKQFLEDSFKSAINSTPQMQALANTVKGKFNDLFDLAHEKGLIKSFIDNYITQIWKKEDLDNPAANILRDDANTGKFPLNISMARKRTFANAFEGMLHGKKLLTGDPITLLQNYMNSVGEAVSNRNLKERILNLRASDGSPLAMLNGSGRLIENEEGDPTVLVNPKSTRNMAIGEDELQKIKNSGDFDRLLEDGRIVKLKHENKDLYAWSPHGYKATGSGGMEDWNYAAHGPDGTPVLVKSQYLVHPEAYDYVRRLVGQETSPIKAIQPLNWLLRGSTEAKHMMLSFSPFHLAQEGLRGIMTGVTPFGLERMNINESPALQRLVERGLTRGKEHLAIGDFNDAIDEGLGGRSKLLDAIGKAGDKLGIAGKPLSVLRDIQNWTTDFIFDKYLPSLKERAALKLNDRWTEKLQDDDFFSKLQKQHEEYKGLSKEDAAAKLAATEANERFGGLNYEQMGRSVGAQDFLRMTSLAPDWLESEIRSIKRVFDPTGGALLRKDIVRMTAGMWAVSRVLNMLLTGKSHPEAPFGVVQIDANGREKVYSIRTLPTDMLHAATDPLGFLKGRESPLVRSAVELGSGRDFQGRKLTPGNTAIDIIRNNFAPIPVQAVGKSLGGVNPDLSTPDQIVKGAGGTATVYRTEAQKLANELAANKNEAGPVDDAQLRKHRAVIELENNLRSGQTPMTSLHDLVEEGHIAPQEAKKIQKNVEETRKMDPELANLYTKAVRLPMKDFLQIWDAATPNEQTALAKLLLKKRQEYVTKVMKTLSPLERKADPTYQRLKEMFPGAAPY